jgi:hypothetical protein
LKTQRIYRDAALEPAKFRHRRNAACDGLDQTHVSPCPEQADRPVIAGRPSNRRNEKKPLGWEPNGCGWE